MIVHDVKNPEGGTYLPPLTGYFTSLTLTLPLDVLLSLYIPINLKVTETAAGQGDSTPLSPYLEFIHTHTHTHTLNIFLHGLVKTKSITPTYWSLELRPLQNDELVIMSRCPLHGALTQSSSLWCINSNIITWIIHRAK